MENHLSVLRAAEIAKNVFVPIAINLMSPNLETRWSHFQPKDLEGGSGHGGYITTSRQRLE